MLGVFIGVAALIAMVAIGQGANDAVRKQLESLGTNLVVVVPGAVTSQGARGGFGSASTLTVTDAQAIRREDPAVGQVGYLIRQTGQTEFANQNWTTTIQGVTPNYPPITNWQIASRPRDQPRRREQRRPRRAARPDRRQQALCAFGQSDRRRHPGQGRAAARHRHAGSQGPIDLWPGPGRSGHGAVHHRPRPRCSASPRRRKRRRSARSFCRRPIPTISSRG